MRSVVMKNLPSDEAWELQHQNELAGTSPTCKSSFSFFNFRLIQFEKSLIDYFCVIRLFLLKGGVEILEGERKEKQTLATIF